MAKIELEPGEQFEHYHSESSITENLSGSVQIQIGDDERTLAEGEKVTVPADTPHTLMNLGDYPAMVACYHKQD